MIAPEVIPARIDAEAQEALQRTPSRAWRSLRGNPGFWIGSGLVVALFVLAIGAPFFAPHDPAFGFRREGLSLTGDPVGPNAMFPLGTDRLGRDYLSRVLHGARASLVVGVGSNLIATVIGVVVGSVAAFAGTPRMRIGVGRRSLGFAVPVEALLMRATDVTLAFPALLLAIALVAIIGPSLGLITVLVAAFLWTTTARIVYGRVLILKQREWVDAARAIGASNLRILVHHVLPHVTSVIVVYGALGISAAVLFETSLSFLGVGVPPPAPSWGSMIAEHVTYYGTQPRLLLVPGLAIMVTILAFNLVGDALRDALDPHAEAGV